jgi:serine/threonine-protein kinase RsbW
MASSAREPAGPDRIKVIDRFTKPADNRFAVQPKIHAFRIAPEIAAIPSFLDRLEAFAQDAGLPREIGHRLAIVCEECAANTAMHGGGATFIEITLRARRRALNISIEDDGIAFNPLTKAAAETTLRLEDRSIGGLGIHFMRHMLQNISYERCEGCNRLAAELRWTSESGNDVANG